MTQQLTPAIIQAAIAGFEAQKSQIDSQITELRSLLDGHSTTQPTAPTETAKPRKKFSAAARKRMALAQRARFDKLRQDSEPTQAVAEKPKKKKRKMSAAGRKAISDATKKRWAAIRAAKKSA
jgi:hypothetical protein